MDDADFPSNNISQMCCEREGILLLSVIHCCNSVMTGCVSLNTGQVSQT